MNTKIKGNQSEPGWEAFLSKPDFVTDHVLDLVQPQIRKSLGSNPKTMISLEKTTESLVFAYLTASLNLKRIPLKEFMDDFEKKILLACLRLTHGNQKNAAALLGLKPTALFEKMRKHCINGRRIKLSEKLGAIQPQAMK